MNQAEERVAISRQDHQLAIRQSLGIAPFEYSVFRDFWGHNEPRKTANSSSHSFLGIAVNPPELSTCLTPVSLPVGLYSLDDNPKGRFKKGGLLKRPIGVKVDNPDVTLPPGNVQSNPASH
jgi:hypothetical protein